jgi:eukaryotic-like serine/threonine-protein kinase
MLGDHTWRVPELNTMRITLTVTAGPHKGRVFTFAGHDTFIVGRSQRAHFRLPLKDKYFSRVHFLVEVNPPECRLLDMGSRNGTYVNGHRVRTADLKDKDRIKAGKTLLSISFEHDESQAAQLADPVLTASTWPPIQAPPVAERPTGPAHQPLHQSQQSTDACRICASVISPVTRASSRDPIASDPLGLCPACQRQILNQSQPIPGYQVVRELGHGGMGVVYLAIRSADDRLVALKTVIPAVAGSRVQLERFLREASILRALDHPHIVAFHEMGVASGQLYFAMDYVRGVDAAQLLRSHGPLPISRAVRLVCQLLEALDYAHGKGFVHRDVKPSNMLVTTAGPVREGRTAESEVVKLSDFGLARIYQASMLSGLTMTGDVGGSAAFMAPEQITNFRESKPPVDQYSAGATLYNLLTGRLIYDFPRQVERQFLMILQDEPVPIRTRRADVPEKLAEIVHRTLAREPGDRFRDLRALRGALLGLAT